MSICTCFSFPSLFIERSGGVARLDTEGKLDESLDKTRVRQPPLRTL
ncbi:hypothetical protein M0804_001994 [Polistes exclamans]|nr:hypothetical protein M0804_001994 [Polistes exclamans]